MGPLLQSDLGSNRDIEYIHILAGLWWARQLQNVIAIQSANACSGFSTMKEKCSFILPETVIHPMTLSNCRVRSQGLLGALVAWRRSRWQRQWGTMWASQHYWGGSPVRGVGDMGSGVPLLAESEIQLLWVHIVWKALASSVYPAVWVGNRHCTCRGAPGTGTKRWPI